MARILVVEDEPDLQEVLQFNLQLAGHEVVATQRGSDAARLARAERPHVILLDLMLPDLPGMDVCRALKADPATRAIPVVMLTAKGEEIDRIVGFEVGAEDYVVKPFSIRELLLRIQSILRRGETPVERTPPIRFGKLRIDRDAHRAWVDGEEIELTRLEFRLLLILHDRRNRVQSRSTLLADVWGMTADVNTRTVDTHVKRLREKLAAAGAYIETVRGVGYRFAESADEAGAVSSGAAPARAAGRATAGDAGRSGSRPATASPTRSRSGRRRRGGRPDRRARRRSGADRSGLGLRGPSPMRGSGPSR
jgi:two-component system phosphate regulon response regulator PhoB